MRFLRLQVILAIALGLVAFVPRLRLLTHDTASLLLLPVLKFSSYVATTGRGLVVQRDSYRELHERYRAVCARNVELMMQNTALLAQVYREQHVATHAAFKDAYSLSGALPAHVIGRTLTRAQQTLIVDRGRVHGVEHDMVAIHDGVLLGRVIDVCAWYSTVMLLTDARSSVGCFIDASTQAGIVQGDNDAVLQLEYVAKQHPVQVGNRVISNGQGLIFPAGFLIGRIAAHACDEFYHEITVAPAYDAAVCSGCLLVRREELEHVALQHEQLGVIKSVNWSKISIQSCA